MHKSMINALVFLAVMILLPVSAHSADSEGCQDHPFLTRMPHFSIEDCSAAFDALELTVGLNAEEEEQLKTVEGQVTRISYCIEDGSQAPSDLQIRRNYESAIKKIGGSVIYNGDNCLCARTVKNGQEIWIAVRVFNGGETIQLAIAEIEAMVQEVSANDMYEALNRDGFMALYINFDTGKALIKPQSLPIIAQVVALLKENPSLKLGIEGHTDNVGEAVFNKALSQERAEAVMAALVERGIASGRLSATGRGQEVPLADNRSEEGRAKNRRVEIVKR